MPGTERPLIEPHVPDGWWFAYTADDVGVLAPDKAFCEGLDDFDPSNANASELVTAAEIVMAKGYPATAQVFARLADRRGGSTERTNACLVRSYRALGREVLAKRHEDHPLF